MRIVFDTNVLLSAMFTRGLCEELLDAFVDRTQDTVVISERILREFTDRASTKFEAPADEVARAVEFLRNNAELVEPAEVPITACRDAQDLPILGTALAARADYLVTGDRDLLVLQEIQAVRIISPRELFQKIQ